MGTYAVQCCSRPCAWQAHGQRGMGMQEDTSTYAHAPAWKSASEANAAAGVSPAAPPHASSANVEAEKSWPVVAHRYTQRASRCGARWLGERAGGHITLHRQPAQGGKVAGPHPYRCALGWLGERVVG
eukprot:365617-Chlamydomonas_euryale.AAC.7